MQRPKLKPKLVGVLFIAAFVVAILIALNLWVILLCYVLGVASHAYRRWMKGWPVGNELSTVGAVVVGLQYGSPAGALFGAITAISMQVVAFDMDAGMLLQVSGTAFAGFIAPLLPFPPFVSIVILQIVVSAFAQIPSLLGDATMRFEFFSVVFTKTVFVIGMWNALYRFLV